MIVGSGSVWRATEVMLSGVLVLQLVSAHRIKVNAADNWKNRSSRTLCFMEDSLTAVAGAEAQESARPWQLMGHGVSSARDPGLAQRLRTRQMARLTQSMVSRSLAVGSLCFACS